MQINTSCLSKSCLSMGIRFWPLLSHFWPIGLKNFMGTQKTVIYRLVMRNHDLGIFGGKIGVAATLAPKGLGSQDKRTAQGAVWCENKGLSSKILY